MRLHAGDRGCGRSVRSVWAACGQLAVSAREFGFCPALVERTEGCKQLVESMPGPVPCARVLTDAPLKSHNPPAEERLLPVTPTPAPFSDGALEALRDQVTHRAIFERRPELFLPRSFGQK